MSRGQTDRGQREEDGGLATLRTKASVSPPLPRVGAPVLEGERHFHWPPPSVHSTRKHPLPVHRPACLLQRAHHFSLDHEDARGLAPLPTEAVAWLGRRGRRSRARGECLLHWRSGSLHNTQMHPLSTGQATSPKANVPRPTSTSLFPRPRRGPGSSNTSDQDGRLAPVPWGEVPRARGGTARPLGAIVRAQPSKGPSALPLSTCQDIPGTVPSTFPSTRYTPGV